jgi:hypothetical protein
VRDDLTRGEQKSPRTLYALDEPTVGLHIVDVEKLTRVLHRLGRPGRHLQAIVTEPEAATPRWDAAASGCAAGLRAGWRVQ